jgi:hypothetical protein
MLIQLLAAGAVSALNIAIHALIMTMVIRVAHTMAGRATGHPALFLTGIMVANVLVLMAAHTAEVAVWALSYRVLDAVPPGTSTFYFAFVNYTTLGYGDVVPVREWQLLGPATAMNGVLLFGWSTAVIFEVLRRALAKL